MSSYVPSIGTKGIYKLKSPLDNLLIPEVVYECIGIQKLSNIISDGKDPLTEYYSPIGLTDSDCEKDLVNNEVLVSLRAGNGYTATVPASYLESYPDVGGVPYIQLAIAVHIGPIPSSLDLTPVRDKIESVVKEYIGVDSEARLIATSLPTIVPHHTHDSIELIRTNTIATAETDYTRYMRAQAQLDLAYIKIRELESHILASTN